MILDQQQDLPISAKKIAAENFPGTQEEKIQRIKTIII